MPGIKKKWIKASHNDQTIQDPPEETEDIGDEDRELAEPVEKDDAPPPQTLKPKKRPATGGMLKGLDSEVLLEKRKRFTPPAELKLTEWLDTNLEKRTEETLNLTQLYNYYTELCQGEASDIVDVPLFNRMIKQKFGKAFGLTENSLYKSVIKERKLNQEKKSKYLGISVKDAAIEAITFCGNPWHGVRFFSLKQYIGSKYPALQIDLKPKVLKRSLEMQVQFGKIDLVKGIGMAGYYKIPGGEGPPPKVKPTKKSSDGETKDEDTKAEDGETEKDETEEDKEKSKENGEENGENKDDNEEEKKKKSKPKKVHHVKYSEISHGSPQRIEDTFPLAITYQSAPKASSIHRIRKYIQDKYGETVPDTRWRQAIERGVDRGWWEYVSGSGMTGKILLLMDDFDPASSSIEDQICAAIIACHEPKVAGANSIKKYVSEYHPDFLIDARPGLFKKALIRAVSKNIVVQVSGLGANGSFQLTAPFIPSPTILAGDDDSDEEEEADDEDREYVTKGTKSRGVPKGKRLDILTSPSRMKAATGRGRPAVSKSKGKKQLPKSQGSKTGKKRSASRGKGRKRSPSPLTDEEEEEEKPSRKSPAKKGRKRSPSPLTDEEESPEYTPVKSRSRGQPVKGNSKSLKAKIVKDGKGGNTLKVNISTSKNVKTSRGGRKTNTPSKPAVDVSEASDEDVDEPVEYTPKKSTSRGGGSAANRNKQSSGKKSKKVEEVSDAEDEEAEESPEYTPKKSRSRGKPSGRKSAKEEEGSDAEDEEAPEYTPKKSTSRGGKSSASSTPASAKAGKRKRGR